MIEAVLKDPVFGVYGILILGLLGLGGLVLGFCHLMGKNVRSVWATYKGWLIMAPLLLISFGLGRITAQFFLFLVAIGAVKEFSKATGLYRDWFMVVAVYLGISLLTTVTMMVDPRTGELGWYGMFMAMPVYAVVLILLIPILRNRNKGQLQTLSLAIMCFVYFGWMFGHLGFLANSEFGLGYLFFLVFAVELNDISAFLFGKLFGRTPLASNISPNKTVEGSLGALLVSFALPFIFQFTFPSFSTGQLLLTGLIIGVGSQFGDLAVSVIKRDLGVKDMGVSIPGHGGVLDRIDSLILVAPLFFHMVRWFKAF